jgi:ATP-dependent exoDNAse (exonuclease V) beta subunit
MMGTIYDDDYKTEHLQSVVDNLNLLYVAFTRASKALFVIGKRNNKASRSALIEQVLPEVVEQLNGAELTGEEDSKAVMRFTYGTLQQEQLEKGEEIEHNVFLKKSTIQPLGIEVFEQKHEFKQSNDSRRFAAEEDDEQQRQESYIQMGSVLHQVFSTIKTIDDIPTALRRMELDGIVYDANITREKIESLIRKRISNPKVANWYSNEWTLYNECTILTKDPHTGAVYERRPDRVMTNGKETLVVDFKFGHPRSDYYDQVREYMQLLKEMGHDLVKGYLWYVYSNQIEEVQ